MRRYTRYRDNAREFIRLVEVAFGFNGVQHIIGNAYINHMQGTTQASSRLKIMTRLCPKKRNCVIGSNGGAPDTSRRAIDTTGHIHRDPDCICFIERLDQVSKRAINITRQPGTEKRVHNEHGTVEFVRVRR